MAMGTRKPGQIPMFLAPDQLPQAPTTPFFDKLNELLAEMGFDAYVENLCRPFYAKRLGRPSLAPGVYFRLLLGYLLGIDSERGIALTVSDSLGLRALLGYELQDSPPDHSTISRRRRRISLETHEQVCAWVLQQLRQAGLADGQTLAVDATLLFANAALRTLRRKDSQQGYREFVEGLAEAAGVPTPSLAELAALDRQRQPKTLSHQEWESPTDPDARVAKLKDGTTHLAHKAEHAVDLESGALVAVTLQAADQGDTTTLGQTLEAVEAAQGRGPETVVADKGYHSDAVLLGLDEAGQAAHIPEPQRAERDFEGKPEAQRVVEGNRERVTSTAGKRLHKLRTEKVERSMAHRYGTGGMRRLYLRGRANIRKRLLVHACAFNLGVLLRSVTGVGTPRTLQGQGCQPTANLGCSVCLPLRHAWSGLLGLLRGLLGRRRGESPEFAAKLA
jgi:transposase